jgi:hypothetical protein
MILICYRNLKNINKISKQNTAFIVTCTATPTTTHSIRWLTVAIVFYFFSFLVSYCFLIILFVFKLRAALHNIIRKLIFSFITLGKTHYIRVTFLWSFRTKWLVKDSPMSTAWSNWINMRLIIAPGRMVKRVILVHLRISILIKLIRIQNRYYIVRIIFSHYRCQRISNLIFSNIQ